MKRNLILQTIYQILNTCLPLITAPYLSRRLGAEQLGIFSYTSSVVAYFTLIAMLGTVNYGTRSIAAAKDDRESRSEIFWSIFSLQTLAVVTASIAYGGYLLFFCRENQFISILQMLHLISCLFDINWFFFGMEKFEITVSRSILIKLLTLVLILFLVKTPEDLWIYTLIMLGGMVMSQLVLFVYLPWFVSFRKPGISKVISHLKPNLVLFVPLLAMSVYHTMDKTMLGVLSNYEQSGFYYNSDKIINIPINIINGIGTVMLPRMSALVSKKKQGDANNLLSTTLEGVSVISIALACGIAAVSNEFIPIFYGRGYEPCVLLTIAFSPILIVKSFSIIIRTQYLIPMEMESKFTKSVVGGAIANLLFNAILIPQYGAFGATIATFFAEFIACAFQFLSLRNCNLGILKVLKQTGKYLVIGLAMIFFVRLVSLIQVNTLIKLLAEITFGAFFYCTTCLFFWARTGNKFYKLIVCSIFKKRGLGNE